MLYNALSIIKFLVNYRSFITIDKAIENIEKRLVKKVVFCFCFKFTLPSFIDKLKVQLQLYPKAPTLSAPNLSYWVGNFPPIHSLISN